MIPTGGSSEQTLVSISHHVLYAYNSPSTEESVRGLKETLGIPPKIVFLMPSSSDGSWFAEQAIVRDARWLSSNSLLVISEL